MRKQVDAKNFDSQRQGELQRIELIKVKNENSDLKEGMETIHLENQELKTQVSQLIQAKNQVEEKAMQLMDQTYPLKDELA
jgi:hypothetical protein